MVVDTVLAATAAAAALLLLASGLAKVAGPDAAVPMLAAVSAAVLPRAPRRPAVLRPVARAAGLAEVTIGSLVLVVGGPLPAALLALAYAGFAAVALLLATASAPVSCGCFGRSDTPVTRGHVLLNVAAVIVGAAAAARSIPPGGGLFDDGPLVAVTGSLLTGLLAWLAYLSITALPALSSARRLVEAQ